MSKDAIAVAFHHVSKRYLTGSKYYPSLRDWVATFFSREFFKGKQSFYALHGLNFTVRKGEVVGFIGPNGSGKSTILRLISRVTLPTSGSIETNGKIAGLLELGAGFHPELTGRENIFFQGSILGMDKSEIAERTHDIIAFAALGEFIDSPIKHFSSGMYARLGFSVAIHLNPDVLLIDEVLAVGDAQFREKCYSRIEQFCENTTKSVILVSHSLPMLDRLCQRLYWIDKGEIVDEGLPKEIISKYLKHTGSREGV